MAMHTRPLCTAWAGPGLCDDLPHPLPQAQRIHVHAPVVAMHSEQAALTLQYRYSSVCAMCTGRSTGSWARPAVSNFCFISLDSFCLSVLMCKLWQFWIVLVTSTNTMRSLSR